MVFLILREIVVKRKPLECKGNRSRSLDNMAGRISFNVVDSRELMFPKLTKISHQKPRQKHKIYDIEHFTGRVIKRRCFPYS
jgi:hypothetical protein